MDALAQNKGESPGLVQCCYVQYAVRIINAIMVSFITYIVLCSIALVFYRWQKRCVIRARHGPGKPLDELQAELQKKQ